MENKVGYYHKRLDNGEIFYVGIGEITRPYETKYRNNHWNHTVNKIGYEIVIVNEGLTWEEACEWEISEIKRIGRRDLGLGPLVNMTNGGEGTQGVIITEERKKNISLAVKRAMRNPEVIQKMKDAKIDFTPWNKGVSCFVGEENPNYGNKWSDNQKNDLGKKLQEVYKDGFTEEHINKLKEKRKGRTPSLGINHTQQQKTKWSEQRRGDNHPQSIITTEDVFWIRQHYDSKSDKYNYNGLAKLYNVSRGCITNIVNRRTWKHL